MKLKKSVKRIIIIAVILIIAGSSFIAYESLNKKETKKATVVNEIKEYGYTLKSNKSEKYKEMFQELKNILSKDEVDEKAYVEQISKMFILDFYSLDDKLANTDVGGVDFLHQDAKTNFLEKSEDTIYKYVENNIYGNRNQDLPEVDNITIDNIDTVEYTIGTDNTDQEAYQVEIEWTYKKDMDYQNKATLTFVHEGKKLSLVEVK